MVLLIGLVFGAVAIQIHAEDVPLADGVLWKESTQFEKKAYLVGASNFMSIEYAYQQRNGKPPSDEQTTIRRFWDHTEGVSLDAAIAGIDKWYANNPDHFNRAVLDVIWVIWVAPNLK